MTTIKRPSTFLCEHAQIYCHFSHRVLQSTVVSVVCTVFYTFIINLHQYLSHSSIMKTHAIQVSMKFFSRDHNSNYH